LLLERDQSKPAEAQSGFERAIELAQNSKSLELCASTGLARLKRGTDRRDKGRTMLAEIPRT
jgi:hypothetical protein